MTHPVPTPPARLLRGRDMADTLPPDLRTVLKAAVQLVDDDVIRVRDTDRHLLLSWLESANAAITAVPGQPVAWIDKNGNIKNGLDAMLAPNEWFTPLYAAPQAVPVPAGWVMVPVKPTQAMRDALRISSRRDYPSDELCNVRYAAMLAAAPKEQP